MRVADVLREAGLEESEDAIAVAIAASVSQLDRALSASVPPLSPGAVASLLDGGFDLSVTSEQERKAWRVANAKEAAVLLANSLDVATAGRLLGTNIADVHDRLSRGALFGFQLQGAWRLPAWQFARGGALPGLATVLASLTVNDPLAVTLFFTTPNADLIVGDAVVSPCDWLLEGLSLDRVASLLESQLVS